MERLKEIWDRQKKFDSIFFNYNKSDLIIRQARTKEIALCLISEVNEVLENINWKQHRENKIKINKQKITEEIIDVFKYCLCLALAWGITEDEFYKEFKRKSKIVEARFKNEANKIKYLNEK